MNTNPFSRKIKAENAFTEVLDLCYLVVHLFVLNLIATTSKVEQRLPQCCRIMSHFPESAPIVPMAL